MAQFELDTKGLLCPMPVIKTQNMIQSLTPGDTVLVTATDPGVLHDIPAWCRINGHKVISAEEKNQEIHIIVEVQES